MANSSRFRPVRSMAVQSSRTMQTPQTVSPPSELEPTTTEPPVRRWPHPIPFGEPEQPPEPTLHYIRCAISYQNQLLADIKALLQRLVPEEK